MSHIRPYGWLCLSMLLFSFCGCGGGKADSIDWILKQDSKTTDGATSIDQIVGRMREIDLTSCPRDFATAYVAHIHAWELLADYVRQSKDYDENYNSFGGFIQAVVRGAIGDTFGMTKESVADQKRLGSSYENARQAILLSFHKVEEVAVSYGATPMKKR